MTELTDDQIETLSMTAYPAENAALIAALAQPVQPAPPHECKTEAEKAAYAFGWWKAIEQIRNNAQTVISQIKEPS